MTTRTDIHRPSAIVPSDYQFVAFDYYGPDNGFMCAAERQAFRAHVAQTGGKFADHDHGGTCDVCGASALYVAKFYHPKTNRYIVTGQDCAQKMEIGNDSAFTVFHQRAKAEAAAQAGKRKAQTVLAAADLSEAWVIYTTSKATEYEENTIRDIVSKLVRYGSVSDKALGFVRSLLARIPERTAKAAARAVEQAAAAPVPVTDARIVIEGEILSTKVVESRFGSVLKMLVKTDAGTKLWGSVPAAISPVKGDRVKLVAKVEPSKDDPKFGFFSRPAQAVIVTASVPVAA